MVRTVQNAAKAVEGNRTAIDAFSGRIQSGEAAAFEATYTTTGTAPATVIYAVDPPDDLAFSDTPSASAGGSTHVIVNSSGSYTCSPPTSTQSTWACQPHGAPGSISSAAEDPILDLYTPSHWVAFLKGLSLAAGLAGDTVSRSTMTVNGFALQCVDLVVPGTVGTNTICTTDKDILGYVKVASSDTSFAISSYTSSPPASVFALPPGATVARVSATS